MDKFCELVSDVTSFSARGGALTFIENEPMKNHTSFKIGGPARLFICPRDFEALKYTLDCAKKRDVRTYILGRGTNVLFCDCGFSGAVISLSEMSSIKIEGESIFCGAGASFTAVSRAATDASLSGLAFAYGIPGSVGGAVYMNAGAYNGEVSCVLSGSTYYDRCTGETSSISLEEHDFSYRHSSYMVHPERVIISAEFKLLCGDKEEIKREADSYMERRKEKQPLEYPSAGSVFKRYPGRYTAQMIDEVGLKGFSVGGACVSEKHAGFIVNKGGATCDDVLSLIKIVKEKIFKVYGIEIETEIIYIE